MEAIAKLHSDLKAVETSVENAERRLHEVEVELKAIATENELIKRQTDKNERVLQENRQVLKERTELLGALSLKERQLRVKYSSALFAFKQIPLAFEATFNEFQKECAVHTTRMVELMSEESIKRSLDDECALERLVPSITEARRLLAATRERKRAAIAKQYENQSERLRGCQLEKARLERRLVQLQTEAPIQVPPPRTAAAAVTAAPAAAAAAVAPGLS